MSGVSGGLQREVGAPESEHESAPSSRELVEMKEKVDTMAAEIRALRQGLRASPSVRAESGRPKERHHKRSHDQDRSSRGVRDRRAGGKHSRSRSRSLSRSRKRRRSASGRRSEATGGVRRSPDRLLALLAPPSPRHASRGSPGPSHGGAGPSDPQKGGRQEPREMTGSLHKGSPRNV